VKTLRGLFRVRALDSSRLPTSEGVRGQQPTPQPTEEERAAQIAALAESKRLRQERNRLKSGQKNAANLAKQNLSPTDRARQEQERAQARRARKIRQAAAKKKKKARLMRQNQAKVVVVSGGAFESNRRRH
jgi:hypothetical protein